ncbi:MAG: hypothetical protein AAGD07_15345 [Planctomycetota bacterium]
MGDVMRYWRCWLVDHTESRGCFQQESSVNDAAWRFVEDDVLPHHADHDYALMFEVVVHEEDADGNEVGEQKRIQVECELSACVSMTEELS